MRVCVSSLVLVFSLIGNESHFFFEPARGPLGRFVLSFASGLRVVQSAGGKEMRQKREKAL